MEPPPGHAGYKAPVVETSKARPKPFQNQMALAPFAVLALAGLAATIVFALVTIFELLDILDRHPSPNSLEARREPLLTSPKNSLAFLVALFGGGLCFLGWLWRANENIGSRQRRVAKSAGHNFLMWVFFGWAFIAWSVLRPVLGPVVNSMFNCIERSGTKASPGSWFVGTVWWVLWTASSIMLVAVGLRFWVGNAGNSNGVDATIQTAVGALAVHCVSLVFAIILVVITTARQDARLRN